MSLDAMDLINAAFEYGGTVAVVPSIAAILRDKRVHGLSALTPMFFASWGWWNLFYYPHLHQPMSAIGAVFLAGANSLYLFLVVKYGKGSRRHPDGLISLTRVTGVKR